MGNGASVQQDVPQAVTAQKYAVSDEGKDSNTDNVDSTPAVAEAKQCTSKDAPSAKNNEKSVTSDEEENKRLSKNNLHSKTFWTKELKAAIANDPTTKVRKSFIVALHPQAAQITRAFCHAKRLKVQYETSLRSTVAPPTTESSLIHPAAWLINDANWQIGMDEYGNTYYYNATTGESQWDPPAELLQTESLPATELTFAVEVPDYAVPGQPFTTTLHSTEIQILCPLDAEVGSVLELTCPTESLESYYDPDTTQSYYDADNFAGPADTSADEEGPSDNIPIDPSAAWKSLADTGGFDTASLEKDAAKASAIVSSISEGTYLAAELFQLGWAYKFSVFQSAVFACFRLRGDFFDSSPYDNCDGTPRYEQAGFIEWCNDLTRQRMSLEEEMNGDGWAEKLSSENLLEHSASEYSKMAAIQEDEQKFLEALIQREKEASETLRNLQSRILAVVCVEGGPSRESLDNIHDFLYDTLHDESNQDKDIQQEVEELEEKLADELQARHKFVVDVVLNIVTLEDELESLAKQIQKYQRRAAGESAASDDEGDGRSESKILSKSEKAVADAAAAADVVAAGGGIAGEDTAAFLAEYEAKGKKLEAELLLKKEQQMKKLRDRLAQRRQKRVEELEAEGLSHEEAVRRANEEIQEDAVEVAAIEKEFADAMKEFHDERLAAIRQRGLETADKLQAALEHDRDVAKGNLRDRLAKKRAAAGESPDPATQAEIDALEEETDAAIAKLDSDCELSIQSTRIAILSAIKEEHDKECSRVEAELLAQRERRTKQLKARLEKKRADRSKELMNDQNENLSTAEVVAIVSAEFADEEKEELTKIDSECIAATDAANKAVLANLRDAQAKEASRLADELAYQESAQRSRVQNMLQRKKRAREAAAAQEGKVSPRGPKADREEQEAMAEIAASVAALKQNNEKQVALLGDFLLTKKTAAEKSLQARLDKRAATSAAFASASVSVSAGGVDAADTDSPTTGDEKIVAAEESKETVNPDAYIANRKDCQNVLLSRIKTLSEVNKAVIVEEGLNHAHGTHAGSGATGGDEKSTAKVKKAEALLYYSSFLELASQGYKKRNLYEIMNIKNFIAESGDRKAEFSVKHVDYLRSKDFIANACSEATEKIIARQFKDIAGVIASLAAERSSTITALTNNGCSMERIIEADLAIDEKLFSSVNGEMKNAMTSISSVWIRSDTLGKYAYQGLKETIAGTDNSGEGDGDECDEEEDNFLSPEVLPFVPVFKAWLIEVLPLINIHSLAVSTFLNTIIAIRRKFDSHADDEFVEDSTIAFRQKLIAFVIRRIMNSLLVKLRELMSATPAEATALVAKEKVEEDIKTALLSTDDKAAEGEGSVLQLAATCSATSSTQEVYISFLKEFVNNPCVGISLEAENRLANHSSAASSAPPKLLSPSKRRSSRSLSSSRLQSMTSSKRLMDMANGRVGILSRALDNLFEKKKKELDAMQPRPVNIDSLSLALQTTHDKIKNILKTTDPAKLGEITVEGLSEAINRAAAGAEIEELSTLNGIQEELDKKQDQEKEEKEVKLMLKKQSESADQLNMAMKLERAKRQQQLQAKLHAKRNKSRSK